MAFHRLIGWFMVVAFFAGLLLTGITKVRRDAALARCKVNLKHVGFGVVNYREFRHHFPTGTRPNSALAPEDRLSWLFEIDPYVHGRMDSEWNRYRTEPWHSENNLRLARQQMIIYQCPSYPITVTPDGLTITNYVAVAGVGADAATLPPDDQRCGVIGYDRKVRLDQITDGLSTTIIVAETAADIGPYMAGGQPTVRGYVVAQSPPIGQGRPFGGNHSYGTHVLFADDSVRFIRDMVSPDTLAALFTMAGRETPGDYDIE